MGIRLIYGRAGTGKSEYCFKEIAEKIKNKEKIYMITPEQFSFTAEKKLLEAVPNNAVIQAEVLTFMRMAYRVIQQTQGNKVSLSNCGKSMLIYSIIEKQRNKLKFLGKTEETIEVVENAITEFKKHNVTTEQLKELIDKIEDPYLQAKLKDISILYEEFQSKIKNNYIDENDSLTILQQNLEKIDEFKNSIIYIDEFSGFTKQEYELIKILAKIAKQITITITTDSLKINKTPDMDVFYDNKQTVSKLMNIIQEEKIVMEENIELKESYRYKTEELKHLERNWYKTPYTQYEKKVENINLFLANNPYTEVEQVAKKIVEFIKQGLQYSDIAIITKDIQTYSSLIKAIFTQYEIPVFIDEKKDLSDNILVKYLLAILEIFAKNWSQESMFQYIKSGFSSISDSDIFELENYCIKWGIKYNKWYIQDWKQGENCEKMNLLRKQIVEPLIKIKEKLQATKTTKQIAKLIYEFLIENEIDKKLKQKSEQLEQKEEIEIANSYLTSWNSVIEVLDEMVLVLGEEEISFERFAKELKIGISNKGLGKIPATIDQVIVGDVERSRSHKVQHIIIMGLNDGVFPSNHKTEGFLNDEDRKNIKQLGTELAKGTLDKMYEETFNIYKAFTTAENSLYLTYSSADIQGKSLRGSILLTKLKKIFPQLIEQSDMVEKNEEIINQQTAFEQLLTQINQYKKIESLPTKWKNIYQYFLENKKYCEKLNQAIKAINYTNQPEKINQKNIQKLYGNTLYTSISRLEQYKKCPYSFYLKYALGISEGEKFKIETLDTGTFMHDVIDSFFKRVRQQQIELKELQDAQIQEIVEEIINEKLGINKNYIFTSTKKYKILTNRLKKVIIKSLKYIIQSLVQSEFSVWGNEIEFKNNSTYPPIVIDIENEKKVEITGKIDRVDIAKIDGKKYVRIIDYKSSVKNIELNEVVAGLQIQLLTYLDAITKIEDMIPAGVLYFNLIDPILKSDKKLEKEELEDKIKKQFKMNGLILADVKVVKAMDKTLDSGFSQIVPAYIDSNDNLSNTKSSTVTKEQFEDLQRYIKKTVKQIANEILEGNIELKPYYNTKKKKSACEWCAYKTVCNFTPGFCENSYLYLPNKSKEEILEEIKK